MKFRVFAFLILFLLSACGPASLPPPAEPTAGASPLPPTATLEPSQTPAPTLTATATETPLPSLTPTQDYIPLVFPKGPTLLFLNNNTGMRVFWQWSETAVFQVAWGRDESYALGSADVAEYDAENHLYAFDFSGLEPGTLYRYRVALNLSAAEGSFRTAPAENASALKFVSYGDTRSFPERHEEVAGQVLALTQADPDYQTFNLFGGDFVTSGDLEEDWQEEFFDPALVNIRAMLANVAILPAIGNHEGGGHLFLRYFGLPFVRARYGSFDYGPAHIVLLDQYVPYGPDSNQYAWLEQDLAQSAKTWKIVVLHEPAWSAGGGHDNNAEAQALQPLFARYGVALVIGGHNHYYARAEVGGIQHLTIGTGGAPTYTPIPSMPRVITTYAGTGYARFEIEGSRLTGTFIAVDGTVQDTFTLER